MGCEDWEAVLNLAGDLAGVPVDDALEVVWEDNEPRSESELMDALTKPRSLGGHRHPGPAQGRRRRRRGTAQGAGLAGG